MSFPAGETPPTPGLGEVVKLFVRYLGLSTVSAFREGGGGESPRWRNVEVVGKNKDLGYYGCWNHCLQRPLYRFLLRTFLFCPMAASLKNVSQVFSVWISYVEPWTIKGDEFSELDAMMNDGKTDNSVSASASGGGGFTLQWQDYVLSNYLYYTSLVMHFIGFAHRFLHSDVEIVVQMVLKVCFLTLFFLHSQIFPILGNLRFLLGEFMLGQGQFSLLTYGFVVVDVCL